ncbi:hypothetical protein AGMMS49579_25260 [Spirochaetia bacterium]|nr:hypothetical protein AGMMS49579_25260 [Spirochaetia bacterium]
MLRIDFKLYNKEIESQYITECGLMLLSLIEGDLKIYNNETLFFDEPYVNLLELSVQLYRWIHNNIKNNFVYDCMDNEEPILIFTKTNNKYWLIDSIWKKGDTFSIENRMLYNKIKNYIKTLDKQLKRQYGIKTLDLIKKNIH